MFHLKAKGVENNRRNMSGSVVSISSIKFVFPFCPMPRGYFVVPITKINWQQDASVLSEFSHYMPLQVDIFNSDQTQILFNFSM